MKSTLLRNIIKEIVIDELSGTSSGGASANFSSGQGEQYATPKAFKKKSSQNKILSRLGFKKLSRPKRPSHTKLFDFL